LHHLDVRSLTADYAGKPVLRGVSFTVTRGAIVSLIGPSGSGKSTILRTLTGLLRPSGGEIRLDERQLDYRKTADVAYARQRIAIVFQQYNLFQNMTALRNVTVTPEKVRKRDKREVEAEAVALLQKVGLGDKLKAYPDELSGGQQQRVAIARALALKPEILLLDEVTSALDPELVHEVLDTVRLLAAEGMTMITVSHEMGFVRELASNVMFLEAGRVIESGPPQQIFEAAREARTRQFIGKTLYR
jgi:polar amino acid transport system ATP-binding protein